MIFRFLKTVLVLALAVVAPLPSSCAPATALPPSGGGVAIAADTGVSVASGWPMPRWARAPASPELRKQQRDGVRDVRRANRTSAPALDLVLYGDGFARSLRTMHRPLFDVFVGRDGLALGVDNCTVECLFWRVRAGGEKLSRAPRVTVVQIGAQNLAEGTSPLDNLDYLLKFLAYKNRDVVLMGLLPTTGKDVAPLNAEYEKLARELGMRYVRCGTNLDVSNRLLFHADGKPTPLASAFVLACLVNRVASSPPAPPAPR